MTLKWNLYFIVEPIHLFHDTVNSPSPELNYRSLMYFICSTLL